MIDRLIEAVRFADTNGPPSMRRKASADFSRMQPFARLDEFKPEANGAGPNN